MTVLPDAPAKTYIVQGEQAIGYRPDHVITTILGSCVSVCLWDQVRHIGGMNHILLPDSQGAMLGAGASAMETLINAMMKAGAAKLDCRAKVFGGAAIIDGLSDIGSRNAAFAMGYLKTEGIEVVAHSTGGRSARQIRFWPSTGQAQQRLVQASDVAPEAVSAVPAGNDIELL
ncbi:MAG: chemotaxis protein CheD [Pseudomonadota bacterium]